MSARLDLFLQMASATGDPAERDQYIDAYRNEVRRDAMAVADAETSRKEQEYAALRNEMVALGSELSAAQRENARLRAELDDLQAIDADRLKLSEENVRLSEENARLRAELKKTTDEWRKTALKEGMAHATIERVRVVLGSEESFADAPIEDRIRAALNND